MKKKIVIDMALNIAASALPIVLLQLVLYPYIAKFLGGEEYGLLLTIYSVWMIVSNPLGNVLNNIRLLNNSKYIDNNQEGDFVNIFSILMAFNTIAVLVIVSFYTSFSFRHILGSVLVAILLMTKAYLEVEFRIHLNYFNILINSISLSLGFIVGTLLYRATDYWELIFITGYAFSCGFCLKKTNLLKEKRGKTSFYRETIKDTSFLTVATVINNFMGYLDKLIIYPLVGGYAVSIYYTATILGKVISMVSHPITSVILSYISQWKKENKKTVNRVLIMGLVVSIAGYFVVLIVSKPVIHLLYPQWESDVLKYIPITTVTVMLSTYIALLNPFVLKLCEMKWQIIINIASVVSYFLFAVLFYTKMGLMGFCIGTGIGTLVKLLIMFLVLHLGNNSNMEG